MLACSGGKSKLPAVDVNVEELPMIHTEDIVSLVSDSGVTRYRLITKVWDTFQNDTASYWHFPEGIYVEQFDSLFNIEATLKADTAYHYENRSLWRVIGNVFIQNAEGITLDTEELFWDEKAPPTSNRAIYTDKFVKVVTADGEVMQGVGMYSDMEMNNIMFLSSSAEFEFQEETVAKQENDSTANANEEAARETIIPENAKPEENKTRNNTEIA